MAGRLGLLHRATLGCLLCASCTLTSSLDELSSGHPDAGGAGATGGAGGSAGVGGGFPDASAGNGGSSGSGAVAGQAGTGGSSGAGGSSTLDPPWWDAAWTERAQIFVQSSATLPLAAGFEVGFELDVAATFGTTTTTFAIARWSEASQSWSARPTYYESVGGTIWIWTPLPANLSPNDVESSLYLHTGNPSAGPADPSSVFLFFDGFDATSSAWLTQGSASFGAGELVLPPHSSIRSASQYAPGHAVDFALEVDAAVTGQYDWICGGFQRSVDFDNVEPWLIWVNRTAGNIRPEVEISAVNAQELGATAPLPLAQRRIYGVERFAARAVFRRDNRIEQSLSWSTQYATSMQVRLTTQSADAQATFDFVRIRRASDPPPSVTLGSTESAP